MARGSRQGTQQTKNSSSAETLASFIKNDLSVAEQEDLFGETGAAERLEESEDNPPEQEFVLRNILGQLASKKDLPGAIAALLGQEEARLEKVLQTLPQPSLRSRLLSPFREAPDRILLARWVEALRGANFTSPSGKKLWSYATGKHPSAEHLIKHPPEKKEMRAQLLLLESQRVVDASPELGRLRSDLLLELGRLRDEASLAGVRARATVFLLPHAGWILGNPITLRSREPDLCGTEREDTIFVFGQTISQKALLWQGGSALDNLLHITRRELICSLQPKEKLEETWQHDMREALAEALNIYRSFTLYRDSPGQPARQKIPWQTSHNLQITALENLLLPQTDDFEQTLDTLNALPQKKREKMLSSILGRDARQAWADACEALS